MKKKVLVTGSSGYIGSLLVKKLMKDENYQIIAMTRKISLMPEWLLGDNRISVVAADIRNLKNINSSLEKVDIVVHLAADLNTFEKNKRLYMTNIVGLKNILRACDKMNKKILFIFVSSIEVGINRSDYARSKAEGEKIVLNYCKGKSLIKPLIVRLGNVYDDQGGGILSNLTVLAQSRGWEFDLLKRKYGNQKLYLITRDVLVNKLVELVKQRQTSQKAVELFSETLSVNQWIDRLVEKKCLFSSKSNIKLPSFFAELMILVGRVTCRADLLIFLGLRND